LCRPHALRDGFHNWAKRHDVTCRPVLTFCQLDCVPGIAIEEAFDRLPRPLAPGLHVPRELQADCLRVVASVCFLATGADRLIEPEVLSKDLARNLDARTRDPATAERLIEKAKRRGELGWHVGQHERVLHLSRPGMATAPATARYATSTRIGHISGCCRRAVSRAPGASFSDFTCRGFRHVMQSVHLHFFINYLDDSPQLVNRQMPNVSRQLRYPYAFTFSAIAVNCSIAVSRSSAIS
jgi:hypothetical protein